MLSNGDVFCYVGDQWFMLGGRWILSRIKQAFFSYVKSGWPDSKSLSYDLEGVFELSIFEPPSEVKPKYDEIERDPIWLKKFTENVTKVCSIIELKKLESQNL